MFKVALHTRSHGKNDWINETKEFARIPVQGEYLITSDKSEWYRVQIVVHYAYPDEIKADVYAVLVNHHEVMRSEMPDRPPNY